MWRQNPLAENRDSDQSISDDEDFNRNWPNPRNLYQGLKNKDDAEMPVFQDRESEFIQSSRKVFQSISDEEKISDDEDNILPSEFSKSVKSQKDNLHSFDCENQDGASTWSAVLKETKDLMCLHENVGSSSSHPANSKAMKNWKGSKGKEKPKFSIRFQSQKEETSLPFIAKDKNEKSSKAPQMLQGLEDLECIVKEHSMSELLEGLQEGKEKESENHQVLTELRALGNNNTEHSMDELQGGFQGNVGPLQGIYKMNKKAKHKRLLLPVKKNLSLLGDRILDEYPSEPMDSSTSSEDEEDLNAAAKFLLPANDQNQPMLQNPGIRQLAMADIFQEALNAAALNDVGTHFTTSKQTEIGFYGRLQQVMQNDKESHMEFLKQSEEVMNRNGDSRCIDVKILSRYLDAKLIVCQCSFVETMKKSKCVHGPENIVDGDGRRTIIFSSRISGNVELEVGNFVRIHPPWKEVQVMRNHENIILCTYLSQISR